MVITYTNVLPILRKKKSPEKLVVVTKAQLVLINMFSPTFVPSLMTLTWNAEISQLITWFIMRMYI